MPANGLVLIVGFALGVATTFGFGFTATGFGDGTGVGLSCSIIGAGTRCASSIINATATITFEKRFITD
jgi:hypothetical protein